MITDLCRLGVIAGFSVLCLEFLAYIVTRAYGMTAGDLYPMWRRTRARIRRLVRVVLRRPIARQRRHGEPRRRVLAPVQHPASEPVARAAESCELAPRSAGSVKATGTGSAVPISPQRGTVAAGPAQPSARCADAPPQPASAIGGTAAREECVAASGHTTNEGVS